MFSIITIAASIIAPDRDGDAPECHDVRAHAGEAIPMMPAECRSAE